MNNYFIVILRIFITQLKCCVV